MPNLNAAARAFTATPATPENPTPVAGADVLIEDAEIFSRISARVYPEWDWVNTISGQYNGGYAMRDDTRGVTTPTNEVARNFTTSVRLMIRDSTGLRISDRLARALARPMLSYLTRVNAEHERDTERQRQRTVRAQAQTREANELATTYRWERDALQNADQTASDRVEQALTLLDRYNEAVTTAGEWLNAGEDLIAKYAAFRKFESVMLTMAADAPRVAARVAEQAIINDAPAPTGPDGENLQPSEPTTEDLQPF